MRERLVPRGKRELRATSAKGVCLERRGRRGRKEKEGPSAIRGQEEAEVPSDLWGRMVIKERRAMSDRGVHWVQSVPPDAKDLSAKMEKREESARKV